MRGPKALWRKLGGRLGGQSNLWSAPGPVGGVVWRAGVEELRAGRSRWRGRRGWGFFAALRGGAADGLERREGNGAGVAQQEVTSAGALGVGGGEHGEGALGGVAGGLRALAFELAGDTARQVEGVLHVVGAIEALVLLQRRGLGAV